MDFEQQLELLTTRTFLLARVTPTDESIGYFEEQEMTCMLCGNVFTSTEAEAEIASDHGTPLCPNESALPPAPEESPHSIMESMILETLKLTGEVTLQDLSVEMSPDDEYDNALYQQVRLAVKRMESQGLVVVSRKPAAEGHEVLRKVDSVIVSEEVTDDGRVFVTKMTEYKRTITHRPLVHVVLAS